MSLLQKERIENEVLRHQQQNLATEVKRKGQQWSEEKVKILEVLDEVNECKERALHALRQAEMCIRDQSVTLFCQRRGPIELRALSKWHKYAIRKSAPRPCIRRLHPHIRMRTSWGYWRVHQEIGDVKYIARRGLRKAVQLFRANGL